MRDQRRAAGLRLDNELAAHAVDHDHGDVFAVGGTRLMQSGVRHRIRRLESQLFAEEG